MSLESPTSTSISTSSPSLSKRPFTAVDGTASGDQDNRRKDPKVSRACDICKAKKIRCSGTRPCNNCTRRKLSCAYNAKYARGRPATPPPSSTARVEEATPATTLGQTPDDDNATPAEGSLRSSPELEIESQYFDPTSGLTFLHRAWRKLSQSAAAGMSPYGPTEMDSQDQLLTSAGDRPFYIDEAPSASISIPDSPTARSLLEFYHDTCVVTYRMLHRQTTEIWMESILTNREQNRPITHSVGHAKCAIILTILAIAAFRREKINGAISVDDEAAALRRSDPLFCAAMSLIDAERGFPRLESAQARIIQVIYLLQTFRMNKGWYTFGNAFQIISSLGLHRRRDHQHHHQGFSSDYITSQCCKRTFWTAYTIDKYLSVVFGRPRLYQDEDIDQDFPESVDDENMTPQGPVISEEDSSDCHVNSLIYHAKIARIIGRISLEVYSVGNTPKHERIAAAHRLGRELHEWRASLPLHLGSIKLSTLVPSFRRQAIALQLAYSHAIIHANRPFLLGDETTTSNAPAPVVDNIAECISAAKLTLELVDGMARDSSLFHSFWWTHYVTFCALAVVYVWQIQRGGVNSSSNKNIWHTRLFDLAERCRFHLMRATSRASPNRRYSFILEELRLGAQAAQEQVVADSSSHSIQQPRSHNISQQPGYEEFPLDPETAILNGGGGGPSNLYPMPDLLSTWQTSDWLDLDSSAFYFPTFDIDL